MDPAAKVTRKMASTSAVLVSLVALLVSVQGAEKLTVHIVPHTHDDVGWLKTVDQYYYGGMFPGIIVVSKVYFA